MFFMDFNLKFSPSNLQTYFSKYLALFNNTLYLNLIWVYDYMSTLADADNYFSRSAFT